MCEAASGVNTKDKVLWIPQFNRHHLILEHYGIRDEKTLPDFVKWECTPHSIDGVPDYNEPLEKWIFKIDQDVLPEWAVPEYEEKRAREILPEWYKSHIGGRCTDADNIIFSGGDHSTLTGGSFSTLTGGEGSVLIIHFWNEGPEYKTYVKKITEKTAGKKFTVGNGKWREIKNKGA